MPRFFIHTFGCQMNEADSEAMARLLARAGYGLAERAEEADFILVNTCCVRAKPEQKVYSLLGELRPLKARNPELIIAVAGCMAQKEGERLLARVPCVDLIIGTRQFHRLEELIHTCREGGRRMAVLGLEDDPSEARAAPIVVAAPNSASNLKAFVPIILGCDNYCSYCIVPYVRGRQQSRPAAEIEAEVARLAEGGCKEVTLLGQNVLAYGRDLAEGGDFAGLLERLNEVGGIERLRFTTAHPRDVNDRLIEAAAKLPKVCEHFHLPVQAGQDRLLAAMNRGYTTAYYLEMARKIRAALPGVSITTDIMVGFPGETQSEFEESLEFYRQVGFDQAFMFAFTPRPGTPAEKMEGEVPREVKVARLNRLIEQMNAQALARNQAAVGKTGEVLVEGASEKDARKLAGRLRNNKFVVFPGTIDLAGRRVEVALREAFMWGFMGEMQAKK